MLAIRNFRKNSSSEAAGVKKLRAAAQSTANTMICDRFNAVAATMTGTV